MEKTLTSIVYFASPAARSTFGRVKLSGQISAAQIAKLTRSCVAIRAASADNAKQAEAICNNWKKQNEDVYAYLMDILIQ